MTLDTAYSALSNALDGEGHGSLCSYRCLRPECPHDHECAVCEATDSLPPVGYLDPITLPDGSVGDWCPWSAASADECATIRERAVAGRSDDIPTCPTHPDALRVCPSCGGDQYDCRSHGCDPDR